MTIYLMQGEYLSECTYLVVEEGKALIIDPGASSDRIICECGRIGATPIAVLLTHGHLDHTFGVQGLMEKGVKVYAHKEEFAVTQGRANLALAFGLKERSFTPDVALKDDEELAIDPFIVKVLHTPGHTQGGVCYLIGNALFSGDTLFPGSYGRTDFPTGDEQDLICSIANVLFELPRETEVYCGHADATPDARISSPQSTIAEEYTTNPILYLL